MLHSTPLKATLIQIEEGLLQQCKEYAKNQGKPFQKLVADLLLKELQSTQQVQQ